MNDFIKPYFKYAQFTGRADRKEFWYFVLFYVVVSAILTVLDGALFTGGRAYSTSGVWTYSTSGPLASIFGIASFIPGLAVSIRRLHDVGKSGWYVLLNLIPLVGWIIMIFFYAQKGEPQTNVYGEPPEGSLPV